MGNPRLENAKPKAISGLIFDVAEREGAVNSLSLWKDGRK